MAMHSMQQVIWTCDRCSAKQNIEVLRGNSARPKDWGKLTIWRNGIHKDLDLCPTCMCNLSAMLEPRK